MCYLYLVFRRAATLNITPAIRTFPQHYVTTPVTTLTLRINLETLMVPGIRNSNSETPLAIRKLGSKIDTDVSYRGVASCGTPKENPRQYGIRQVLPSSVVKTGYFKVVWYILFIETVC